ncbi:MAG: exosortase family protein XrtF [Flexibacter sp. CG_4_10_14_3_um_filter_32_15]|nr:MAG: exosortase family protein XrtF [Flexibacter sp. CG_4_10_14_3_um_filter_32_15]
MKNPVTRFVILFIAIYGSWYLVYELYLAENTSIDRILIEWVGKSSTELLTWFGFDASYQVLPHTVSLNSISCVSVGAPCNGLALFALFASFILATPVSIKPKLVFIPLGVAVIFLLNVIRIAALTLNVKYYPESVDFNHHYLFTFIVYGVTFWIWIIWVNKFMIPSLKQGKI